MTIYSRIYLQKKTNGLLMAVGGIIALFSIILAFTLHKPATLTPITENKLSQYDLANMSSNQVTFFWESAQKEPGWIEYGLTKDDLTARTYDDRDVAGDLRPYLYHLVTLKDLKEDTDYYYRIVTTSGAYIVGGTALSHFRTPKKSLQITNAKPAYGKILLPNGKPGENILVYLQIENRYPMVALSKQTGEWLIPLNMLVSRNKENNTVGVTADTAVRIRFFNEDGKSTFISTNLANVTPLSRTILLGKDYALPSNSDVLSATAQNQQGKSTFTVVYPRENGLIPVGRPLIKGTGVAGADVFVFINSKPQFAYRATVDSKGEWRVLPTQSIGAGSYIAAVTSKDEKGGKITINRHFIIAKSGEQVLGTATGEPTLIPTPTSAPLPTGTTITPTRIPSPTIIAYVSPTPGPTLYASPTIPFTNPTTVPQPPQSGANFGFMLIMGIAFLVMGGGLMLVF